MDSTILIVYLISVLFPISTSILYDLAYSERMKRLGYIYSEKKGIFENIFTTIPNVLLTLIVSLIPLLNVIIGCVMFKDFDASFNESIRKALNKGEIKKIEKTVVQEEYLNKRIKEAKELQSKLGYRNQVNSISDFTIDEKIAFYLRELELLYEEKARLEGIDLDSEINFATDEAEERKLRLELK